MKEKTGIAKVVKKIADFGAFVCGAFVAINIAIIFASVFMRYVFNKPILGTTELVALLMPYIAYFGIAYTASVNGHVQMAALYDKYKGRHKYISQVIIYGLTLIYFTLLVYMGTKNFMISVNKMEKVTAAVTLYAWVGKFAVPAGSVLMWIHTVYMFISSLIKSVKYKKDDEEVAA